MDDNVIKDGVASGGAVSLRAEDRSTSVPVRLERLRVHRGSMDAYLLMEAPFDRTSAAPGFAPAVVALLPGLAEHVCLAEAGAALRIVDELADTTTAHAIEHVALELLNRSHGPGERAGHTAWGPWGPNRSRVRIESPDDVSGTAALTFAVGIVNGLLSGDDARLLLDRALERLEELRERDQR